MVAGKLLKYIKEFISFRHSLQICRPETDLGDFTFPVDTANKCFILQIRETTHPKSHTH